MAIKPTQLRLERQEIAGAIDSGCGATSLALGTRNDLLVAFSGTHEVARLPLQEGLTRDACGCADSPTAGGADTAPLLRAVAAQARDHRRAVASSGPWEPSSHREGPAHAQEQQG